MRIAICDDDTYYLELLNQIIIKYRQEYRDIEIFTYTCGEDIVYAYKNKGLRFEIIFLDIRMKKLNGIDAAKIISEIDSSVLIFFVTAFIDYVFQGYEVRAYRYIMKPFSEEQIKKHFLRAVKEIYYNEKRYAIHTKSTILTYNIDDVLYLESLKRQVFVITTNERVGFYSKLSKEEDKLKLFGFIRVHQGFLINMAYIKTIIENDIVLINDTLIPISKSRKKETLNHYTKYLTEFDGI